MWIKVYSDVCVGCDAPGPVASDPRTSATLVYKIPQSEPSKLISLSSPI